MMKSKGTRPPLQSQLFWGICLVVAMLSATISAVAEVPAVAAVMDDLTVKLSVGRDMKAMAALTNETILDTMTDEQRQLLGTEYWTFDVNVPVVVSVMRDTKQETPPFWLEDQGFLKTALSARNEMYTYEVWQKSFPAGRVGLGVNGFDRHRPHYFVSVGAQTQGVQPEVSNIVPFTHNPFLFTKGAPIYMDWPDLVVEEVSAPLEGQVLLPTIRGRAREAELIGVFRETHRAATAFPDLPVLTWSDDPQTTQTIQWRTSLDGDRDSALQYRVKDDTEGSWIQAKGSYVELYDRNIVNDSRVLWHTATLEGLEPGTVYAYALGKGNPETDALLVSEFRTAPKESDEITFLWMSDNHSRPESAAVLSAAWEKHPKADFLVISGDHVGTGQHREDWDMTFSLFSAFLRERPLMSCIGNHDAIDGLGSGLYRTLLRYPDNGPEGLLRGQSYSFTYGDLFMVSLDVTEEIDVQTAWLEQTLRENEEARWKVAVFHFPPYALEREYPEIEELWVPLFDKYHVDLALTGHVHHYLRTYPMNGGKVVDSPQDGTIYLISVSIDGRPESGSAPDYAEVVNRDGFATCTAFTVSHFHLIFNVYKADGTVYDSLMMTK
ncbi:MAG: metallophosphoesterase family protein [Candidatus Hydrogenedentales bacterium]|jgi:hypothetical protein